MLARKVDKIMVGFEESRENYKQRSKVLVTGTPVRCEFTAMTREQAKAALGLPADLPLVVSVWGSLGADHMNQIMSELITHMPENEFSLIHATGKRGYKRFMERLENAGAANRKNVDVREYIYNMPVVMEAADLVLCRAGASTLSELAVLGKPALLVPSPNVTNNHQEKNARVLEGAGAARVLLEGQFTAESLLSDMRTLLSDSVALQAMSRNMSTQGNIQATDEIAEILIDMARQHKK